MTRAVRTVLAEALQLDLQSRAALAAAPPGGIEGPSDSGAETAWDAEIRRRIAALEAGTANPEPWEEVRRRTEREIRSR